MKRSPKESVQHKRICPSHALDSFFISSQSPLVSFNNPCGAGETADTAEFYGKAGYHGVVVLEGRLDPVRVSGSAGIYLSTRIYASTSAYSA